MLEYSIGDSPDDEEFRAYISFGEIEFATINYVQDKTLITLHPAVIKADFEMDSEELAEIIQKASSRLREFYVKKSDV